MVDWNWKDQTGSGEVLKGVDGKPKPRVGDPPPCGKCPKESPDKEHQHMLSAKNWQTYQFALAVEASHGGCLTERMKTDGMLLQNLAIIRQVSKAAERNQLLEAILAVPRL